MGQQQMLLLVLTVVIVGAAIIVGINAFSENTSNANYDAMLNDIVRMAEDARVWKSKPELMGGSSDHLKSTQSSFAGVNFANMGYSAEKVYGDGGECYANINGEFELIGFFGGLAIIARNVAHETFVVGVLTGSKEDGLQVIGILRGGAFVSNGTDWSGRFPTLPNC
jgi:hypothetical protein